MPKKRVVHEPRCATHLVSQWILVFLPSHMERTFKCQFMLERLLSDHCPVYSAFYPAYFRVAAPQPHQVLNSLIVVKKASYTA